MYCPVCETVELKIAERQNIEIDYCPTCRGVWLDRGELDKIIERSSNIEGPRLGDMVKEKRGKPKKRKNDYRAQDQDDRWRDNDNYRARNDRWRDDDDDDDRYDDRYRKSDRHRRKRDFLEDIFDIFD